MPIGIKLEFQKSAGIKMTLQLAPEPQLPALYSFLSQECATHASFQNKQYTDVDRKDNGDKLFCQQMDEQIPPLISLLQATVWLFTLVKPMAKTVDEAWSGIVNVRDVIASILLRHPATLSMLIGIEIHAKEDVEDETSVAVTSNETSLLGWPHLHCALILSANNIDSFRAHAMGDNVRALFADLDMIDNMRSGRSKAPGCSRIVRYVTKNSRSIDVYNKIGMPPCKVYGRGNDLFTIVMARANRSQRTSIDVPAGVPMKSETPIISTIDIDSLKSYGFNRAEQFRKAVGQVMRDSGLIFHDNDLKQITGTLTLEIATIIGSTRDERIRRLLARTEAVYPVLGDVSSFRERFCEFVMEDVYSRASGIPVDRREVRKGWYEFDDGILDVDEYIFISNQLSQNIGGLAARRFKGITCSDIFYKLENGYACQMLASFFLILTNGRFMELNHDCPSLGSAGELLLQILSDIPCIKARTKFAIILLQGLANSGKSYIIQAVTAFLPPDSYGPITAAGMHTGVQFENKQLITVDDKSLNASGLSQDFLKESTNGAPMGVNPKGTAPRIITPQVMYMMAANNGNSMMQSKDRMTEPEAKGWIAPCMIPTKTPISQTLYAHQIYEMYEEDLGPDGKVVKRRSVRTETRYITRTDELVSKKITAKNEQPEQFGPMPVPNNNTLALAGSIDERLMPFKFMYEIPMELRIDPQARTKASNTEAPALLCFLVWHRNSRKFPSLIMKDEDIGTYRRTS